MTTSRTTSLKTQKNKELYSIFINNGNGYTKQIDFSIDESDFDEIDEPVKNLFISNPEKGEIIIGASCCGNFKTTELYYYKFFDKINNWILYKKSSSIIESDFIPSIDINYLDYSYLINGKISDNKRIKENELTRITKESESYFNTQFYKYKKANDNKLKEVSGNLNFDDLAELLYFIPINKENINRYNDFAYYLLSCKDGNAASIFLLKEILKKDSKRTVAYLNLGDAEWELKNNSEAKKSYQKYISLMKSQNKDLKKIPQRVHDRIK